MNDRTLKAMWAATLLTVIFTVNAVMHGPNSTVAAGIVAAIAGLGGFALAGRRKGS